MAKYTILFVSLAPETVTKTDMAEAESYALGKEEFVSITYIGD